MGCKGGCTLPANEKTMNRKFRRGLIVLLIAGAGLLIYKWPRYGNTYFQPPLDQELHLAANFGELRENHFHMGLDIRTLGREGLPVYAAAGGYISRIEIQSDGLGYALYLAHPNGLTTVYGHLSRFADPLQHYTHQRQYETSSWEQAVDLSPDRFPVKKGDLIALSGNTGASRAPHLHFEVRDTKTGRNLNPLLAGFTVEDNLPPVINGLYWYDRRYSTYSTRARKIAIAGKGGRYHTTEPVIRFNSPLVSLGINATDKNSGSPHISGIFAAQLWMDDSLVLSFRLHDLLPSDTRYINACIDYTKWIRSGIYVQHLSILPGNHAPLFSTTSRGRDKDGCIHLTDTLVHRIRVQVSDASDNSAELSLQVQYAGPALGMEKGGLAIAAREEGASGVKASTTQYHPPARSGTHAASAVFIQTNTYDMPKPSADLPFGTSLLVPGHAATVNGRSCRIHFSAAAFYDGLAFQLHEDPSSGVSGNGIIKASALIHVHDPSVPVHDRFTIAIRTILQKDNLLRNRTVMQLISGDSQSIVKGSWDGEWMSGSFSRLGTVQLLVDQVPPAISTIGWTDGQTFPHDATGLSIAARDNLGAIAAFRGELDGHWIPFSLKANNFTYAFDTTCAPGKHRLSITVTDVAGNATNQVFSFIKE